MAVSRQIPPRFQTEILFSLFLFLSSCDFSSVHLWLREKRGGEQRKKGGLILGNGSLDKEFDAQNPTNNDDNNDKNNIDNDNFNNSSKEGLLGEEGAELGIELFFRSHLVHAHLSTLQKSKSFFFFF